MITRWLVHDLYIAALRPALRWHRVHRGRAAGRLVVSISLIIGSEIWQHALAHFHAGAGRIRLSIGT